MRDTTIVNTQSYTLHTTNPATEVLPPNPFRKAFLLSPVAGGNGSAGPLVAVAFAAGAVTNWQVPAGVTQIIDIFVWGAGGDSGAAGAVLGGGGGGGGAFGTAGPLTVIPGAVYQVTVNAHGTGGTTKIANSGGVTITSSGDGANGVLDAAGAAGATGTAVVKKAGGAGAAATALGGPGGGGGGAGGNNAVGTAGAGQVAGVGGGATTYSTYGAGGNGGAGSNANVAGVAGTSPGGGGGGGGATTGAVGAGADGLIVIFYVPSTAQQAISLSPRPDVAVGSGAIQYDPGMTFPFMLTDADVGSGITEPWYAISGVDGTIIQVVEYSYAPGTIEPAY